MLPVYRVSEGVQNLEYNYSTFNDCIKIFKAGGIVLIFSEGRCINEWHLRSLKKGTARLATSAWQQDIPVKILPLGINYSTFRSFGKTLKINFGEILYENDFESTSSSGKAMVDFNKKLEVELKKLVFEINPSDKKTFKKYFRTSTGIIKKMLLFLPALIGYILHFPLYYSIAFLIQKKAEDHFDSVMVALLFILYPIYVLAITLVLFFVTASLISFSLLLISPLSVLALLHFKN